MATETKINDIASQLSTASRLVISTDFFWVYTASGLQVKIPAEFVRAYLVNGVKPSINANGNWEIDGEDLGVVAKGVTPKFRGGNDGIEVSYDNGSTWSMLALYTSMSPIISDLVEADAYTKEDIATILAAYIKTVDADKKYLGKTEKAASASNADNSAMVNNHTVNTDVPSNAKFTDTEYVIPTLSSAPTSSTLTFTDNGVTRSFKVGYMCRVADSSAEHGYKFYQLYDISNGKATWG